MRDSRRMSCGAGRVAGFRAGEMTDEEAATTERFPMKGLPRKQSGAFRTKRRMETG